MNVSYATPQRDCYCEDVGKCRRRDLQLKVGTVLAVLSLMLVMVVGLVAYKNYYKLQMVQKEYRELVKDVEHQHDVQKELLKELHTLIIDLQENQESKHELLESNVKKSLEESNYDTKHFTANSWNLLPSGVVSLGVPLLAGVQALVGRW